MREENRWEGDIQRCIHIPVMLVMSICYFTWICIDSEVESFDSTMVSTYQKATDIFAQIMAFEMSVETHCY